VYKTQNKTGKGHIIVIRLINTVHIEIQVLTEKALRYTIIPRIAMYLVTRGIQGKAAHVQQENISINDAFQYADHYELP
jgi:hypothetical protein